MSSLIRNKELPVTILLNKIKKLSLNVQKNMEFLFVLKGNINIILNNNKYELVESDVILVANGDMYEIENSEENLVLSIQIDNDFFQDTIEGEHRMFLCNSSVDNNKNYDGVRKNLSQIMYQYSNKEQAYALKTMSLIYELIYLMNRDFIIVEDYNVHSQESKNSKYNKRITSIVSYIKQHYYEQISLQDVANNQYLTPEYLSKFFKIQMGVTFSRYLNRYRLSQANKELVKTDNSIMQIAMKHGFPNLVAFNKIFREVYNTTPAEYRNKIRKRQLIDDGKKEDNRTTEKDIISVNYSQAIEEIKKYAAIEEVKTKVEKHSIEETILVDINPEGVKEVSHSWKNLINLGYAQDGLRSDLQQHLTTLQNKIKFKYARFQGIFSDEMFSYENSRIQEENYNFNKIDKLIDFLYSINLKPFIELGNKAKILSLAGNKIMYFKNSAQRNVKDSVNLLEKFIAHSINRYGITEVSQWYFELWKEGDTNYVFWNGNFDKYLSIFESYYRVIKEMVPNAKVGGPGFNPEVNMRWFKDFLEEVKKRRIKFDFLSVSIYPYELIEDSSNDRTDNSNIREECKQHLLPSKDRNYAKIKLNKIRKIIKESEISIPEIHVTEYNSSISHRHPANDTTFKAAYITKNIIDNLDETNSFGYWFCSDVSGELKDSKDLLYGDMGLVSANGINKPGFHAYEMLSKLGNFLVQKGDGYIVTKKSQYNYEVITYNYKHFDYMHCLKEEASLSVDQYYSIYENEKNLNINMYLRGIKKGNYRIKQYILNRSHGSIFDEWVNMNAINNIKKDEIDYLKQICVPKQKVFYIESDGELKLESFLSAHEVNFFEITFEYR